MRWPEAKSQFRVLIKPNVAKNVLTIEKSTNKPEDHVDCHLNIYLYSKLWYFPYSYTPTAWFAKLSKMRSTDVSRWNLSVYVGGPLLNHIKIKYYNRIHNGNYILYAETTTLCYKALIKQWISPENTEN